MSVDRSVEELAGVDPDWAWETFVPNSAEPWDRTRVAHLFRRAAFCASESDMVAAEKMNPVEVLDGFFAKPLQEPAFESESEELATAVLASGDARQLAFWWLHRMLNGKSPLREKMTLFWHGHFATGADKVTDSRLMFEQNKLLREHSLGDFRRMVHEVAKDPAMLLYLDSASNRKAHPNENFARELMELFCLGEGHYSERDVQELARCFTGWEIRRNRYQFNGFQHDSGKKSILGVGDIVTGEQAIDVVLDQPRAAEFIALKLFRFFVCDEPAPGRELIRRLASEFRNSRLDVSVCVRRILSSRIFYSKWSLGHKVRAPVEYAIGVLKTLEATASFKKLAESLIPTGQVLFYPPNVKGWDGGRAWINSATWVARANLLNRMLVDENTRFAGGKLSDLARSRGGLSVKDFVAWFCKNFCGAPISQEAIEDLVAALKAADSEEQYLEALSLLALRPELQLA